MPRIKNWKEKFILQTNLQNSLISAKYNNFFSYWCTLWHPLRMVECIRMPYKLRIKNEGACRKLSINKSDVIGGGAWGADAPHSECLVPCFWVLSGLFYLLLHFKVTALLKVFYNFTKFPHNFIYWPSQNLFHFNMSSLQHVNLILGFFDYFFTFSFF